MITREHAIRIAKALDCFYKEREPDEQKEYPPGYNPVVCIENRNTYDPNTLSTPVTKRSLTDDQKKSWLELKVKKDFDTSKTFNKNLPIIYTREQEEESDVIGLFDPQTLKYKKIRVNNIEETLKLLNIFRNKPRGFYILSDYPDRTFLQNAEIFSNFMKNLEEVEDTPSKNEFVEVIERMLPGRKPHLRLLSNN
jgi:hypothetical protein